jgi:hypothetical protein
LCLCIHSFVPYRTCSSVDDFCVCDVVDVLHAQMTRAITVGVDVGDGRLPIVARQPTRPSPIFYWRYHKSHPTGTHRKIWFCFSPFLFLLFWGGHRQGWHDPVTVTARPQSFLFRFVTALAFTAHVCVCERVSLNSFLFLSGAARWVGGWQWDMEEKNMGDEVLAA